MSHKKPTAKETDPPATPGTTQERVLCRLDEIAGGGKEAAVPDDDTYTLCLVRQGDKVHAYRNSCPHTGAPLNWGADKFLSLEGTMIQCAVHGALFRIADGMCVWGPCLNRGLTPVAVDIKDGNIVLADMQSPRR